jgi:hypothetical protein
MILNHDKCSTKTTKYDTQNKFFSNLAKPWGHGFSKIFLPVFVCPRNQQTHRETMRIHGIYWKII